MAGLIGLGDGKLTKASDLKTQDGGVRYSLVQAAGNAEGVNPILAGLTTGLKSMVEQGKSNLAERAAMRQWAAKEAINQAQREKLWEREDALREERRGWQLEDRENQYSRQDEVAARKQLSEGVSLPKGARQRYLQFKPTIQAAAEKHGVPADKLAAILMQESSFNPRAVGDNGKSVGMGQFHTGAGWGKTLMKREGLTREQLLNSSPEQQIDWAAEYLSQNAKHFTKDGKTNWRLAIDAYNKGAGNAGKSGVPGDPDYLKRIDHWSSALVDYEADTQTSSRSTKAKEQPPAADRQPQRKAELTAANDVVPAAVEKLNSGSPPQSQGGLKGEMKSEKPEEKTLVQRAKEWVGLDSGEEKPKERPNPFEYDEALDLLNTLAEIDSNFNPSKQEIKDRIEVILSKPNGLEKLRALVKKMRPTPQVEDGGF